MSKLDDITKHIYDHSCGYADICNIETLTSAQATQQIKDLMLELIGEDEQRPAQGAQRNGTAQAVRRAHNQVKQELRKKVTEL
jgi:hypothetical protein